MSHDLFLTTRQTTKIRNVFANKISIDMKISKAQICKAIQSSRCFGSWLGNLAKKTLTNIAITLAKNNLPGLVSNSTSNAINKFERKVSRKEAVKEVSGFSYLFQMKI